MTHPEILETERIGRPEGEVKPRCEVCDEIIVHPIERLKVCSDSCMSIRNALVYCKQVRKSMKGYHCQADRARLRVIRDIEIILDGGEPK